MTQTIKVDSSNIDGSLLTQEMKTKGAKALAASLYRIEDLLKDVQQKTPEINDSGYIESMAEASLEDPKQQAARLAFLQFSEDVKKVGSENIEKVLKESILPALKKMTERRECSTEGSENQNSSQPSDGGLGNALMFLQEFQTTIAQQQVNQNNDLAQVNKQSVQVAQDQLTSVVTQIQAAFEAAAKAAEQPPWMIAIQVFAVLGGALLAGATGGAGAMALALLIGGIMASPVSTDIATAIATDIVNAQGKDSNETAAEKQQAVANIVGKIVVAVMFAIFSMGASAGTSLLTSATTAATTAAEEAGTAGVDAANSWTSKLSSGWGSTWRTGVSEGLASLASSGIVFDMMESSDPNFAKSKKGAALGVILDVVMAILSAYSGFKATSMSGVTRENILEKFGAVGRAFTVGAQLPKVAQDAVQVGFAIKRAEYLSTEAKFTKKLADSQAALQMTLTNMDTMSDAASKLNSTGSNILEGTNEEMDQMASAAGGAASAVNQILAAG